MQPHTFYVLDGTVYKKLGDCYAPAKSAIQFAIDYAMDRAWAVLTGVGPTEIPAKKLVPAKVVATGVGRKVQRGAF